MLEKHITILSSCGREILQIRKHPRLLRLDNSLPGCGERKETAGHGEASFELPSLDVMGKLRAIVCRLKENIPISLLDARKFPWFLPLVKADHFRNCPKSVEKNSEWVFAVPHRESNSGLDLEGILS